MANPISFPSTTPNTGLPLLFSGQAQKEFILNQSLAIIDALMSRGVEAVRSAPPEDPAEGTAYLVGAGSSGTWLGQSDKIAARIGGAWHFVSPRAGMEVFDRERGLRLIFTDGWQSASLPDAAQGGAVIDAEARATLNQLIGILQNAGLLPSA